MHRAHGNAWFLEHVVTLCQKWRRLHPSERVSGEELSALFREWLVRDGKPRGY